MRQGTEVPARLGPLTRRAGQSPVDRDSRPCPATAQTEAAEQKPREVTSWEGRLLFPAFPSRACQLPRRRGARAGGLGDSWW